MVVSWDQEEITDINGYNVHFGAFDNIVFEHTIHNGMNTSVNLGPLPVEDTIAITSLDVLANGAKDQTDGYESDYSFAILAPYAGPDTAICFNSSYSIINATAFNYVSLSWSTSGDGLFSDTHILNPVYNPGPQDFANGFVNLFLNTESNGLQLKDRAIVTFHAAPVVYAGSDTTITIDTTLWLVNATASGNASLKWTTSGDGIFSSDSLCNPVYHPGPGDITAGTAILSLTGFSACGAATATIRLKMDPGYRIVGKVHSGGVLAVNSRLNLYQGQPGKVKQVRNDVIVADGNFEIKALLSGTYYLHAIPDKRDASGYLPTYYFNDIHWENAYKLEISANTYDVDVDLARISVHLPKGAGLIRGYCSSSPGTTDVCSDVTVFLYDKQIKNILDWDFVRNGNDFRFTDLPYGEYMLVGEKAGSPIFTSGLISLSPSHPETEDIVLVCSPAGYKFSVPDYTEPYNIDNIKMFPNPVSDLLNIVGLPGKGENSVCLTSSQGKVYNYFSGSDGIENICISLGAIPSGLYIIEVCEGGTCLLRQKVVKY